MNSDLIQFENSGNDNHEKLQNQEPYNTGSSIDEPIEFEQKELPNIIKVVGVGGGGGNAVNYMFKQGIKGVDFVVCNTDAQALHSSPVPMKVKLGNRKLGAGSKPEVGRQAALDSIEEIKSALAGETEMLFITAGMGGGTGTGAAPVIAVAAKEMDILTVGIVTIPFEWEGQKRLNLAKVGIEELKKHVDTLIVISNNKLREVYGNLSLTQAFSKADDILKTAAKGIAELITVPGYVNVDFEDVKTVMTDNESGKAIMSSAQAEGNERAMRAVQEALSSPLLDDNDIAGASDILLHIITGEKDLMMDEVDEITTYIQSQAGNNANLIWGNGTDSSLGDALSVTIIATGFDKMKQAEEEKNKNRVVIKLDDAPEPTFEKKEENLQNEPKKDVITEPTLIEKDKVEEKKEFDFAAPVNNNTGEPSVKKRIYDLFETKPAQESKTEEEKHVVEDSNEDFLPGVEPSVKKDKERDQKPSSGDNKLGDTRRKKLRDMSSLNRSTMLELEKIPAYQRRNVELDKTTPSSDENISRYTLGSDDKNNPVINKGNSFLHDNVD